MAQHYKLAAHHLLPQEYCRPFLLRKPTVSDTDRRYPDLAYRAIDLARFSAKPNSIFRSTLRTSPASTILIGCSNQFLCFWNFLNILKMSEHGRLSIWKSEPPLDNWYNAVADDNASLHSIGNSDIDEMLFFDISRSNQVTYPSSAVNEWFYNATTEDDADIGSKSNFSSSWSMMYLT